MDFYTRLRPLLFRLAPETAHHLSLLGLRLAHDLGLAQALFGKPPALPHTVMGLRFPNPIGLAAGLDKNAECLDGLGALGFGFIEVGTVTPRPQPGNPQPRLFRLPPAEAIINRMGFNNDGVEALVSRLQRRRFQGIVGVNIGKNAATPLERAADDYVFCLRQVYAHADYVTVNLSSPNTPGLRKLQHGEELRNLLASLKAEQTRLHGESGRYVPLLVKIAPDLEPDELEEIAATLLSAGMDGAVATNTTQSRHGVEHLPHGAETGGLSGAPLRQRSTEIVRRLSAATSGKLPIIAAGGILQAEHALEKIEAGASLVQLYTGLIYRGPALIQEIARRLG